MTTSLVALWMQVRKRLEAAGVDTPVFDARLLLEHGAGVSRLDIVTEPRRMLSADQIAAVEALIVRREAREPISHILGCKQFWTLELTVGPDVLTPRPETETLVEAALELAPSDTALRILDLGVGSGAVLLAVLSERPSATGLGVDVSEAVLAVARSNAEKLTLNERTEWRCGNWGQELEGGFDLVVSNPPYIASGDVGTLAPEVARYEPRAALDGGPDGLDAYRAILPRLPRLLRPGGGFALEVGRGQAEAVAAMARAENLCAIEVRDDLAGIARVVSGRARDPG